VTRRTVALVLAVALALVAFAATACSVPRDDDARIVTNPKPDTSAPVTRPDGPRTQAKVYFVRSSDNKLEAIMTSVRTQAIGQQPGPYELLEALIVDGPQERRLESKIPNNVRFEIRQSPLDDELIVILPNFNVKNVNREALILAFQQMVYTLTELPEVNSVQFSVQNQLYPVPLKSGDKPVGQGVRRLPDYEPDSIYTTTTTSSTTTTTIPQATASSAPAATASVAPGSAPPASATR
jgi:hypothetical protein